MLDFQFQYSNYYIILCALAAALYALLLYWRAKFGIPKAESKVAWLAFLLRFVAVFIISLFLLSPFSKIVKKHIEKPTLVWMVDNSQSIAMADSNILDDLEKWKSDATSQLADKYQMEWYAFANEIGQKNIDFSDKQTNMADALEFASTKYQNSNTAAVIMLSDGLYNQGINPKYANYSLNAPLYSVVLGDTTIRKDALVADVLHNDIVYLGNSFPLMVRVAAKQLKGEQLNLSISRDGKEVGAKNIAVSSDNFAHEENFYFDAESLGVHKYVVSIKKISGETLLENNSKTIFIEVLDAQRKILFLASNPHPDVAALRRSMERNSNYKVDVVWTNSKDFAAKAIDLNLDNYHLAILHSFPGNNVSQSFTQKIAESKLPLFFITANTTNFNLLNKFNVGLEINLRSNAANQVQSGLNESFGFFGINNQQLNQLADYPPLISPFAHYSLQGQQILLQQKIGNIKSNYPLLSFAIINGRKIGLLAAEGIWRWYLHEYKQHENNRILDELMQQSMQFMASKQDKRQFKMITKTPVFNENQAIQFDAELYDKAYNISNDGTIVMQIKDEQNVDYKYNFSPNGKFYSANLGSLKPGEYQYTATAKIGGETFNLNGAFIVKAVQLEQLSLEANQNLMYNIAEQNAGKMFRKNQFDQLLEELKNKKAPAISHEQVEISELINLNWLLFLIVSLLGIEWSIRKFNGVY